MTPEEVAEIREYVEAGGRVSDEATAALAQSWEAEHARAEELAREVERLRKMFRMLHGVEPTAEHFPVGAYHPVGQLDGDCSCGHGPWPCEALTGKVVDLAATCGASNSLIDNSHPCTREPHHEGAHLTANGFSWGLTSQDRDAISKGCQYCPHGIHEGEEYVQLPMTAPAPPWPPRLYAHVRCPSAPRAPSKSGKA